MCLRNTVIVHCYVFCIMATDVGEAGQATNTGDLSRKYGTHDPTKQNCGLASFVENHQLVGVYWLKKHLIGG